MFHVTNMIGFGANVAALTPPSISFRTTASDVTNTATPTFGGALDIGTASATRHVVVAIGGSGGAGAGVASMTVGGIATTTLLGQLSADGISATVEFHIAAVPTGTTATIAPTWNDVKNRTFIAVWAVYDLASAAARDTASSTAQSATLDMDVLIGDIIAVFGSNPISSASAAPTGYTEDFDTQDAETVDYSGGSAVAAVAATPRTITMAWDNGGGSTQHVAVGVVLR